MKKLLFIVTLLMSALALAQPYPDRMPEGNMCDVGATAAATLLIPYWEVDAVDPAGIDTLVGIINVHDYAVVAHVVSWNVDSWPTFDFNIYLTPYDVVTFSMRQIIINGVFPNNFCGGDPSFVFVDGSIDCDGNGRYLDGTNPGGIFSVGTYVMDIACYSAQSSIWIEDKQIKHSIASYDGPTDNYVGYLTIDTALACNGALGLSDVRYVTPNQLDSTPPFDGLTPDHSIIDQTNALMGDFFYYDNTNMVGDGYPAVHIEAFGANNLAISTTLEPHDWGFDQADFDVNNLITFYGKFLIFDAAPVPFADFRESLPVRWGFRYIENESFDGGTWIDAWRSGNPRFSGWYATPGPGDFDLPGGPAYTLLYDYVHGSFPDDLGLHCPPVAFYDEEENTAGGSGGPSPPTGESLCGPRLETQRMAIADFGLPFEAGWMGIAFDTDALFDWLLDNSSIGSWDQAWVNVRYSALGKYTAGLSAIAYLGGCHATPVPGTATVVLAPYYASVNW